MPARETLSRRDVDGRTLAYKALPGAADQPGLFWLSGFKSDMEGSKACHLADFAESRGLANVRFDYSGHGISGGAFEEGTISHWRDESLEMFRATTCGPQIIIGSSMGGWLALLLAREMAKTDPDRLKALVLIAPAPDFTEDLMWAAFPPAVREQLTQEGHFLRPSDYGEPYVITRELIEDGRRNLLLGAPFHVGCPVRILQGSADAEVPWEHALRLVTCLAEDDVVFTLIKGGDHRLSRPEDLSRLSVAVEEFL